MEIGGGGDRRLGTHGLVQLVGQRLHLRQRPGIDVLEHEVQAGERRRPEEVGHQLRPPLIASAADDRHLCWHAATVQSRPWSASDAAPPWHSPPPLPPAASCISSARSPSRRSCRVPCPRSTTPTSFMPAASSSSSAPSVWSGARVGRR